VVNDWIDRVEAHELDWNAAHETAGRHMRRLLREVRRLRSLMTECAEAEDLERVKQIIRADRRANGY
jgi:hypothetical protein